MSKEDHRISSIVEAIQQISSGNYTERIKISKALDDTDAIATGINMLSEEIESRIEEHKKENRKLNDTISQLKSLKLELSKSEELFSMVFQTSPDSISISTLEEGEFLEVNRSFEELTGYKREELIGKSVFDIGLWNDEALRNEMEKRLRDEGSCNNLEASFKVRDGSVKHGLLSASILHIDDKSHILVIGRDISDIKEAEEKLHQTRKKYEDLIRFSPDGIVLLSKSGKIEMANPAFAKLAELPISEIEGMHFKDFTKFNLKDLPKLTRILSQVIKGKTPGPLEMAFKKKDGSIQHIDIHVTPIQEKSGVTGIQAVVRDITERVCAVEALMVSENHYRTSMDSMHDSMYVIDPELNITVVNKSLKEGLLGLGFPADVVGKNYMEAFPFLDKSTVDEYKEVFTTGKTIYKEERFKIADQERFTDSRLIPVFEGKLVSRILTIVQDITERKKAEKVQQIMYNISNAVNLTTGLDELLRVIQNELGNIFDTRNFFIAFYNKEDDTLSLPFFVDEKDAFDYFPAKRTLTGYMIRNDQPILMKNNDINKLVKKGILDDVGSPSAIWLGVPLKIKDDIIGALVVQNYEDENAYNEKDLEILQFVSAQIGLSIETKRAYDEVQVEKAYFEQLFEGSPETIVLTDNEGSLLKVNSEFQKLFGYSAKEAIGKNINNLIVSDEYKTEAQEISDTLARGEKILIETIRKHKNGTPIHVSVLGTPVETEGDQVAVYGIYRDITDRKNAEIALRESEEKLRNILYSSPDAIAVSNMRGYITECNQAAVDLLEWDNEEALIGVNAIKFVNPQFRQIGINTMKQVLRKGHVKNIEFEMITKKKKKIFVDLSASLIRDNNERPIGIVTISQETTERKAYEKDLQLAKEKAEESDRLKSAFLANMSHEIRTPMNAILGFSELLKSDDISRENRDEYIKIINNKGNELMLIINDLIDISKIEAGDIKIVNAEMDVNKFLQQILHQFKEEKSLMKKNHIQLRLMAPDGDRPIIVSDEARLRQIMYNLVNNALKFTHDGYIEIGYTLKDGMVRIYVKDTGIGIAREKQDLIFDRFRQVDESINSEFGGTGLGLSISMNLVNLLAGEIWMESEPGQGSTFFINLPLHENKKAVLSEDDLNAEQNKTDQIIDLRGKKILIAEDDSANYLFLESFLKRTQSEIIWARDGDQLLELFNSESKLDLILMDIRMPHKNGIEATRIIRKTNKDIPVIALTAYAFADDRAKSIEAGCNDYLAKPVKLEKLSETLLKYLK
jgi:PAS domain S-box-containing protein